MNVFIVGPMGAGKTTVGKLLAKELGLDFQDADEELERVAGADISWIFDLEGEEGMRDREEKVLEDLTQRNGLVIATGGGAVERASNRQVLSSRGNVVYLNTPLEIQYQRTRHDNSRPMLRGNDRLETLRRLHESRDPLYREVCDLVVDTGEKNSKAVVNQIIDQLV